LICLDCPYVLFRSPFELCFLDIEYIYRDCWGFFERAVLNIDVPTISGWMIIMA
jgi:hypothetical protein